MTVFNQLSRWLESTFVLIKLSDAGKAYMRCEFYKYVQITVLPAITTVIGFMLLEYGSSDPQIISKLFIWAVPMLLLQVGRYLLSTYALTHPDKKNIHLYYDILDSLTTVWWVAILPILGSVDMTTEEYLRRGMLVYIVFVFYLHVFRYIKSSLVIQPFIICFGLLLYLVECTDLESLFQIKIAALHVYGFFAMILFGGMSHILACSTYHTIHKNEQLVVKLDELLIQDELTGIHNRRYFKAELSKHINHYKRYQKTFCLVLFDIDFFKIVNDEYGHDAGDKILVKLSAFISNQLRKTDIFARYGGEEFVLIFPEETYAEVKDRLEELRQRIAEYKITVNGKKLSVTVSAGVAEISEGDDEDSLMRWADNALYRAKGLGRNRIERG